MADVTKQDLTVGTGAEAADGKLVTVRYTVVVAPNTPVVAPLAPSESVEVVLGGKMLIAGWNQGVAGMKVGGRRRITIPPEHAYGAQGLGDIIPANATLIFEVDLTGVRDVPT